MGPRREFSIRVPYGLFFVRDAEGDDKVEVDRQGGFWRTDSVLAIACQGDVDGPVRILIDGDATAEADLTLLATVDLSVPSRRLSFETVPDHSFFEMQLAVPAARVEVWTVGHYDTDVVRLKIG